MNKRHYLNRTFIVSRMCLLLGACTVTLLCFEGIVRGANRWQQWREQQRVVMPVCTMPDSSLGFRLKPDFSGRRAIEGIFDVIEYTNSMGLRGQREYGPKPDSTFRLIAIGDSFTYGWGVSFEKTFEQRLERLLNANISKRRYEVINIGVPGYNTAQELKWLDQVGAQLEPDIIMTGLYIGDDLTQNARLISEGHQQIETQSKQFYKSEEPDVNFISSLKAVIADNSEAYRLLRERFHRLREAIQGRQKPSGSNAWWLDQYRKDFDLNNNAGYLHTQTLLNQLAQWSRDHHARFLVVLIPDRSQLSFDYWQKSIQDIVSFDPDNYDLMKPNRWLLEYGQYAGIPMLDLLPTFRSVAETQPLYFEEDRHWTDAGHLLAAEALHRFLHDQQLLLEILRPDSMP